MGGKEATDIAKLALEYFDTIQAARDRDAAETSLRIADWLDNNNDVQPSHLAARLRAAGDGKA